MKAENAVIMAAGTSSRFAPLSYERPKALISVKGEVLIERQICQLKEAGISNIYIITGYKHEQFAYLKKQFGVALIHNPDYLIRNNNSSIFAARNILGQSFVCSADNWFDRNPFTDEPDDSYYAAVYARGKTKEWCLSTDPQGYITNVHVGGENEWYMLGHTFWSKEFSTRFLQILVSIYDDPETKDLLWESIYARHLDQLKMKIKKYSADDIFEFDTLDELRDFDPTYWEDTRSAIIRKISDHLHCSQSEITDFKAYKDQNNAAAGFTFMVNQQKYRYDYKTKQFKTECGGQQ